MNEIHISSLFDIRYKVFDLESLTSPNGGVEPAQWGAVGVGPLQGEHALIHTHSAPDWIVIIVFVVAECFA